MVIVSIIGILAAIALPAYQDYSARAKISEVVTQLSNMKTGMSECLMTAEAVTNCTAVEAGINQADIVAASEYISGVSVTQPDASVRTTGQTLFSIDLNWAEIGGGGTGNLTFSAAYCLGGVKWECGLTDIADAKFVPVSCRKLSADALIVVAC